MADDPNCLGQPAGTIPGMEAPGDLRLQDATVIRAARPQDG
eukprot:CAMPEP_0194753358 /NCGR_PEP_ID=MMETSP0323_2-20130528/7314_1 /TAXON_ID=2866 ORGANISM="Crypthecodinium cohnii, Strain Seligo" /NCGR_SAMPLE_ID=MMETSP0323_2 /ASSEMBLY_ACC=CAM_ASM_000346 /LENGTH=40 /DNA_ID= /DNA_START= /DNA_END= /DNA_ORIENTATION=